MSVEDDVLPDDGGKKIEDGKELGGKSSGNHKTNDQKAHAIAEREATRAELFRTAAENQEYNSEIRYNPNQEVMASYTSNGNDGARGAAAWYVGTYNQIEIMTDEQGNVNRSPLVQRAILAHETKHAINEARGVGMQDYIDNVSYAQRNSLYNHDEVSANIAEVLTYRDAFLDATNDEERNKVIEAAREGGKGWYFDAVLEGKIKINSTDPTEFAAEMAFIGEQSYEHWMTEYYPYYANQHYNNLKDHITIPAEDAAMYSANYAEAKRKMYTIGGIDFSKYIPDDKIDERAVNLDQWQLEHPITDEDLEEDCVTYSAAETEFFNSQMGKTYRSYNVPPVKYTENSHQYPPEDNTVEISIVAQNAPIPPSPEQAQDYATIRGLEGEQLQQYERETNTILFDENKMTQTIMGNDADNMPDSLVLQRYGMEPNVTYFGSKRTEIPDMGSPFLAHAALMAQARVDEEHFNNRIDERQLSQELEQDLNRAEPTAENIRVDDSNNQFLLRYRNNGYGR